MAGNRHARERYEAVLRRLLEDKLPLNDAGQRPWFVTIVVENWDIPDTSDRIRPQAIKLLLARLLKSSSWIGLIELVRVNNALGPGGKGKRVCVHVHLLVWGGLANRLRKAVKRRAASLKGGAFGASPITFREVPDKAHLAYRLTYLLKMPVTAKRLIVGDLLDENGELRPQQFTKDDTKPVFRAIARMFLTLDRYPLRALICCGGEGRKVIRQAERVTWPEAVGQARKKHTVK